MNSSNRLRERWRIASTYGLAVAAVGLAWAAREAFMPLWGPAFLPFIFFFPAIVLIAWYGGFGPALVTVGLSTIVAGSFLVQPPLGPLLAPAAVTVALVCFAFVALSIVAGIEAMHRANKRALAALAKRKDFEQSLAEAAREQAALYRLVDRLHRAESLKDIYDAALDAIVSALRCDRASVLLCDDAGVMRFVASRGLSPGYLKAVEGHSPWKPGETNPQPVCIADIATADVSESLKAVVTNEGIGALCFIPLLLNGRLIGKFMAYFNGPHPQSTEEIELALSIGRQLAFGIARKQTEDALRKNEERLRLATQMGNVGIWDWDIQANRISGTDELYSIHGIHKGDIEETREGFATLIHPEDRTMVSQAIDCAVNDSVPYELEFRALKPGGEVIWLFASAMVFRNDDKPARMLGAIVDISEVKRGQQEREALLAREQELRHAAEDANRLKDEFLATMSHELRNPLNVIVGYSELLARSDETKHSPHLRQISEALKRNALSQSHLIGDLLDLSRLRSGKFTLNHETVSLMTAIHNAVETVRAEAIAKGIAFHIAVPNEPLFVSGDLLRFEQIVWNLVNNAVKFTPTGGRISIQLKAERDEIVMTVEDTGQGIDAAFLPHAFDMFRQADVNASRSQSGMGIGLALVRQLVELHHGTVSVHSDGANQGSRFTVRLPASRERILPSAPMKETSSRALHELNVLVVDDSRDTTDMLRRLLELEGAIVVTAGSGSEALEIARDTSFDVIVSDISMPGMDGFELLRRLRRLPLAKDVPVLALTGFGRVEDSNRAQREGFFSHLAKPLDVNAVVRTLRNVHGTKGRPEVHASSA